MKERIGIINHTRLISCTIILLFGISIFFGCTTKTVTNTQLEWSEGVQECFDIPNDSLQMMERRISTGKDSIISLFAFCVDSTFYSENLELYHLIDNVMVKRNYKGNMPCVFDWLWYNAVKGDISNYIEEKTHTKGPFETEDYEQVLRVIEDSLSMFDEGPSECFAACRLVYFAIDRWRLADKYVKMLQETDKTQKDSLIKEWEDAELDIQIRSARKE